ncbi:MAG: ribose transport system permease protein [Solirubrobacterales bacterium]|jgi:ribose transport system permease protein|nr:ribose transport system permease protein [Solirubrobacterales bacterium]
MSDITTDAPQHEPQLDADEDEGRRPSIFERIAANGALRTLLILIAIVLVFSLLQFAEFATVSNVRNIATDVSILLVLAVGMTFVIITAGIDLSVGSVLVFAGVIAGKVMIEVGGNNWGVIIVGLVAALIAGTAWGILNGVLITKARVPPLIVTLGTLGMALGVSQVITDGVDLRDVPFKLVETIGTGKLFNQVPWLVVIAAVVAVFFGVVLAATRFGRHTYAIGSNVDAAQRAGINVDRHLIKVYALTGFLAGLAGFMSLARFSTTTIAGHSTDNLAAIAGTVLGGTSLFGGIGTIAGTVIGMFIPVVLQNGFIITGVKPFWQQVAVGAVLIVAVYLDQLRRRTQYKA